MARGRKKWMNPENKKTHTLTVRVTKRDYDVLTKLGDGVPSSVIRKNLPLILDILGCMDNPKVITEHQILFRDSKGRFVYGIKR